VIGLYLLFSYAATVGWGVAKMAGFSAAPAPLLTLEAGSLADCRDALGRGYQEMTWPGRPWFPDSSTRTATR